MIEPVRIEPEAVYDDGALRQALGVTPATLAAARHAGALRYSRTGKRIFYKGAWVSEWLEQAADTAPKDPRQNSLTVFRFGGLELSCRMQPLSKGLLLGMPVFPC
jgi:hypothetical protein